MSTTIVIVLFLFRLFLSLTQFHSELGRLISKVSTDTKQAISHLQLYIQDQLDQSQKSKILFDVPQASTASPPSHTQCLLETVEEFDKLAPRSCKRTAKISTRFVSLTAFNKLRSYTYHLPCVSIELSWSPIANHGLTRHLHIRYIILPHIQSMPTWCAKKPLQRQKDG